MLKGRIMSDQERDLFEIQLKGFQNAYDCLTRRLIDATYYARNDVNPINTMTESAGVLERMMLDAEHDFNLFYDFAKGLEAIIRGKPGDYFEDYRAEQVDA